MNRLPLDLRVQVLSALCEGVSIRAIVRMTGVAKNTIQKLLHDVGYACDAYQDRVLRDLPCRRVQCDEIWSFTRCKQRNVKPEHQGELGYGDTWTWVAMDEETKLVPCWAVGHRDSATARFFVRDLANRLAHRVQLTTDGLKLYVEAVEDAFGGEIDYAQIVKLYGPDLQEQPRYSQPQCVSTRTYQITGWNANRVTTSHIERQNLTMRMHMRRFTRLTNGFSKKIENHSLAVCLHFFYYNFVKVHSAIKTTPAIAAGVTDRIWTLHDIARLPEQMRGEAA